MREALAHEPGESRPMALAEVGEEDGDVVTALMRAHDDRLRPDDDAGAANAHTPAGGTGQLVVGLQFGHGREKTVEGTVGAVGAQVHRFRRKGGAAFRDSKRHALAHARCPAAL